MKNSCIRYAMAAFVGATLFATTAAAFSGAIYTSNFDATIINQNQYDFKVDVYLNGGPKEFGGPGAIAPDGIYLFEVTDPSTNALLSEDLAKNRQVLVSGGVIFGVPAPGPAPFDADALHAVGSLTASGSIPVQLMPFLNTPNGGGVYKVTMYSVDGGAYPDGMNIITPNGNKKSDNFKVKEETTVLDAIISGRKYLDSDKTGAFGVYDPGEEWTDLDGEGEPTGLPSVTIWVTVGDNAAFPVQTDSEGGWSYPVPPNSSFTVCEEVPDGYTQTGPLDGAYVTSTPEGSNATAAGACWDGVIGGEAEDLANLNFGNIANPVIGGIKFYDLYRDGDLDEGIDVGIEGFKIVLAITVGEVTTYVEVFTDADGNWSAQVPYGASVTVCEVLPSSANWVQSFPGGAGCHDVEFADHDTESLDFGNYCIPPSDGRTLGFWSNKNGAATFGAIGGLGVVNGLPLVGASGNDLADFATHKAFSSWILKATATNMAEMLSAQLAAMALNVEAGFVGEGDVVLIGACYDGDGSPLITIGTLIDLAKQSLENNPNTIASGAARSYQECLKNALDNANNNLNFVSLTPCGVSYPVEE